MSVGAICYQRSMPFAQRLAALALSSLVAVACQREQAHRPPAVPSVATVGSDGRMTITVDDQGYHPATIRAAAGRALTLVFHRTDALNCGDKVRFPTLNIERDLPVGTDVAVAVNAPASGELAFTCGMNMYRGSVVVQ